MTTTSWRRVAIIGEAVLVLAGLVWTGQGLGIVRAFRSFMVDRAEWIVIGLVTSLIGVALLWLTLLRASHATR